MLENAKSVKKVLHVSSAKTWRGGEQQIAYLIEGLKNSGFEPHLLCVENSEIHDYALNAGWRVDTYLKTSSISISTARKIKKYCLDNGIEMLHLHDSHAHTFAVLSQALFRLNLPMVLHRRVDFPVKKNTFSRWKYNHSSIKKIICVSKEIKRILLSDIKQKEILATVHSGIDLQKFSGGCSGVLREEYQLEQELPIIANIASIAPHKDYFTFVDTIAILDQQGFRAHYFVIGGDGGERNLIEDYIFQKGLQNKIIFTGFRKDIQQIIPEIDLLLFTSKTEGLGTSIIDCLCAGVPIVATQAGGIPELIQHRSNGLLAPVQNPELLAQNVVELCSDKKLREKCIQQGALSAKQFSKEQMVSKIVSIYKEIL